MLKMWRIATCFIILLRVYACQDFTPIVDIKTLSELPLEKLLHVKNSLEATDINTQEETEEIHEEDHPLPDKDTPSALALHSEKKPQNRGSYYEDLTYMKPDGKTNIQTIFQTSITALAFLAFGGYLLCLIMQAINGKMNNDQQVIVMQSLVKRPQTRRRRVRRPQRLGRPTNKRPQRHRRDVWPEANPEKMYDALVMLSEAYTHYHTTDFKWYNYTDIDYIIWTGDLPPHDIWNQTREGNLYILRETVKQMLDAFPGIPIFPALGNHESAPAGSFPPPWIEDPEHSISWLYSELVKQWNAWLPSEVDPTVLHGGFYSVLMRPGLRLISLNMNYCHNINWWLIVNSTDPAKELKWLIYELQEAENNGEKVHIIGHIPPGDADCMKTWSRNYYKIIDRYEDTIVAQFFGHRHSDEFEVFYDVENHKRPTGVAFVGPSITTFENLNPGYRIYYVDGDHNDTTWEVVEHESWIMDLEKTNKEDEPDWHRLYTAREAYGFQTLRPEEWAKLIDRMVIDPKLFDLFYRFYYKDSNERPNCDDNKCRLQILCDLKSGKSHDRHFLCHDLEDILRS